MKYGKLSLGQIEAIVNKLGGMEGVNRFLSERTMVTETILKTWKTITLGTYKDVKTFSEAFESGNYLTDGSYAKDVFQDYILDTFCVLPVEEVQLVKVSLADLGLRKTGNFKKICARAKKINLEFCPKKRYNP